MDSPLFVVYTSSDPSVASVTGNTITIVGAGSVDITASQSGDDNYEAAAPVTQSLSVSRAAQTLTFSAPTSPQSYGDQSVELGASSNVAGLSVAYTSSDSAVLAVDILGLATAVGVGSADITASQAGNANYLPAFNITHTVTVIRGQQVISFEPLPVADSDAGTFELAATSNAGLVLTYTSSDTSVATVTGSGTLLLCVVNFFVLS